MTLNELSEAWNELRNRTLGRGLSPLVSAGLATRIANHYERWRKYLETAGPLDDLAASVQASDWLARYRELADAAKAEGVSLPNELAPQITEQLGPAVSKLGMGLIAIGLPLLLFLGWRVTR